MPTGAELMTSTVAPASNRERVSRRASQRQVDKFSVRRDELAAAALQTLSELGYARTSLREIAQNSSYSHGVLHYYFTDKVDLIIHCVRQYKATCVRRYDEIVETSTSAAQLCDGFAEAMAATARDDAPLHRLWYDMRSQSMFEPAFQVDVVEIDESLLQMIWRIVERYSELRGADLIVTPGSAYAIFDGLFQQALLRHHAGDDGALAEMSAQIRELLPNLVAH